MNNFIEIYHTDDAEITDELIDLFNSNPDKHRVGMCAGTHGKMLINKSIKDSTDISVPVEIITQTKYLGYDVSTNEITYFDGGGSSLTQGNQWGQALNWNSNTNQWQITGNTNLAFANNAGFTGQSPNAIAIGQRAGQTNQGTNAIAIGQLAGGFSQGQFSIAIGAFA